MRKIGDYDPFFDFDLLSLLARHERKQFWPNISVIFNRMIALNIRKNQNTLAIKSSEKKGRWLTKLTFFFASIWKKANY
jgi:hypothetical protein